MSSGVVELRPVATGRVGQATAVEQSRAVAEVQAAVIVAQQCPRSVPAAITAMEEACAQIELAARAFFSYPRAGEPVNGPSVHLARELARCWGNIQHGITELARDDMRGESEMQAWAWDVQTNTRSSNTFLVPHKRDTKKGVKDLTDMRDIYENNANNGARRLREAIFSVLPAWYSARAQALCQVTIEGGGGKPLAVRIADAVKAFEKLRVSPARIAAKFRHASVDELTATDVAQLGVVYDSLKQGTVTVDDEFPAEPDRITPSDLAPPKPSPAGTEATPHSVPSGPPADVPAPAGEAPRKPQAATTGQVGMIRNRFRELYPGEESPGDRAQRLIQTAQLAGLEIDTIGTTIGSTKELTSEQAARVLDALKKVTSAKALEVLIGSGEVSGVE
jgi:hypothetical protein